MSPERIRSPTTWAVALAGGSAVSALYAGIVVGYGLLRVSNVGVSEPVWLSTVVSALASLGVVGVPVVVWLRYRLRSPLALAAAVLFFWHVLVEVPPLGSGRGDSPGFLFVFVLAPLYVAAYALSAGIEYRFRRRDASPS